MGKSEAAASTEAPAEEPKQETQEPVKKKKDKYRKDKPWDDGTIDHWKVDKFDAADNKGGHFLEESSFATLFPQYREKYLKQIWSEVTRVLQKYGVACELDLVEGSMVV